MRWITLGRFPATKFWRKDRWQHASPSNLHLVQFGLPLRWRFYFYKAQGTWKLVDLRVDDGLVELFEESIRPRK